MSFHHKITDLNYDAENNVWQIAIDSKIYRISYEDYSSLNLAIGMEIDRDFIEQLEERNLATKARQVAINFLSYRPRSKEEIRQRLRKEKTPPHLIEEVIGYLIEQEYLDDRAFAQLFIEDKIHLSRWSLKKIEFELARKGIPSSLYSDLITAYGDVELANAQELVDRKLAGWKSKSKSDYELKNRVYRYLTQRGFGYSVINTIIEEILS